MVWLLLFWAALALVLYVYFGYPALLLLASRMRRAPSVISVADSVPRVSIVIAAYNEEQAIARKIENSLALDYPRDRLEIIVVSDGSMDGTASVVRGHRPQRIRLVDLPRNVGKASAQNEAVRWATGEILLFTDANVSLRRDVVRRLVEHFSDRKVGCVVGQVTYTNEDENGISEGEGLYWRYELLVRRLESLVGNMLAGSGPIIALRRDLFEPMDPAISEDFVLPMQAAIKGYKTRYEPRAISSERLFQVSPATMFKTRVRTINLDTRSIFLCRSILNPLRYPLYAWGLVSHKLLRWLVPYLLLTLLLANLFLLDQPFYVLAIVGQLSCYGLAALGYIWQTKGKPPRLLGVPFSFCLVNLAAAVGLARFVAGKKSGRWQPVRRLALEDTLPNSNAR